MIHILRPFIKRLPQILIFFAASYLCTALYGDSHVALEDQSTTQLEARIVTIDAQLLQLADTTMRSGVGSTGYRSDSYSPDKDEWVQIDLAEPTWIDQVVLVPSICRGSGMMVKTDAFPLEFEVIAGLAGDSTGTVLARLGPADHLLPRVAPVVISFPPMEAAWVRVEALTLSQREWDNLDSLQLSELLIFSGMENVALHQSVKAASSDDYINGGYHRHYLVDGFMPYLMTASQGEQSVAFLSQEHPGAHPTIRIDLETVQTLDQINLHSVDVSNKIPQTTPNDFATPRGLIVEGALKPDFSDAVQLVEYQVQSIYDTGPIMSLRFPETACRYIRLTVTLPFPTHQNFNSQSKIGFAEIELLTHGKNVARGSAVSANFKLDNPNRSFGALTDGRNFYGDVLPLRDWLGQLALRHELQTERPRIEVILKERYVRQKNKLSILSWLFAGVLAGTVIIILIYRITQQHAINRIRKRIAADLHDELGANLYGLGILSDLAQKSTTNPDKLKTLLQRIRAVSEQCGTAARYCTDTLEAEEIYQDVPEQMRRAARRLLADIDYHISLEGEEFLYRLTPRQRIDLCLFQKECLANILRHSGASQASIQLTATQNKINLTVTDNGRGLSHHEKIIIPTSIQRRSRMLGAHVQIETPEEGGTCVRLLLNLKKFGIV